MITFRKAIASAALVGSTLIGGALGASFLSTADAQTATDPSTTAPAAAAPAPAPAGTAGRHQGAPRDPSQGGHVGQNGTKETLLTGADADKATAAAQAAVPGGTIQRVETDAEGAAFEAHATKADGSQVTVKMDASFNVTGVEAG
jgi:hypothetical protein